MKYINDMQIFVKIIEKGSFSSAGRDLRLSAAVVSSRVARLENRLGLRLFNRTTRKVTATDSGLRYYEDCLDILSRIEEAEHRLSRDSGKMGGKLSGTLRLTSSTSFGTRYLISAISRFAENNPLIHVQLQITDRLVDLLEEGLDLSIRIGPMEDSSFKSRILAKNHRYILASPDYLAKYGIPKTPQELVDHHCLLLRFPGSRQFKWTFQEQDASYDLTTSGRLDSNNGEALRQWALQDQGLVLKSIWEVSDDIRAGRLKIVLKDYMPQNTYIHTLSPYEKYTPHHISHFIDFIAQDMKQQDMFKL